MVCMVDRWSGCTTSVTLMHVIMLVVIILTFDYKIKITFLVLVRSSNILRNELPLLIMLTYIIGTILDQIFPKKVRT